MFILYIVTLFIIKFYSIGITGEISVKARIKEFLAIRMKYRYV